MIRATLASMEIAAMLLSVPVAIPAPASTQVSINIDIGIVPISAADDGSAARGAQSSSEVAVSAMSGGSIVVAATLSIVRRVGAAASKSLLVRETVRSWTFGARGADQERNVCGIARRIIQRGRLEYVALRIV